MNNIQLGLYGERLAQEYLVEQGFELRETNYRSAGFEIDIIAYKNQTLHFIEVKTRAQTLYGDPEKAVTPQKRTHIKKVASYYLEQHPNEFLYIQFDIIALSITHIGLPNQSIDLRYIEDFF